MNDDEVMGERLKGVYRIVLLGDSCVGKSSVLRRLIGSPCSEKYAETVEDCVTRQYELGGYKLEVQFLDTSGTHDFPAMKRLAIQKADIFLLVFSLTDKSSYEALQDYRDEIVREKLCCSEEASKSAKISDLPVVIVANKNDLESLHVVNSKEADFFTAFKWNVGFYTMSATQDNTIDALYNEILKQCKLPPLSGWQKKPLKMQTSWPGALVRKGSARKQLEKAANCNIS